MRSDSPTRSFATLRIVADDLDPQEVTRILAIRPTFAHKKGDVYSTGRAENIMAKTGIWLFDTRSLLPTDNFNLHLSFVLWYLGLGDAPQSLTRLIELSSFLRHRNAKAVLSLFWHGGPRARAPRNIKPLAKLLEQFSILVDIDFDRDEEPRTVKKAA